METRNINNLQRIRIYPEDRSKEAVAGNLILEIDGKKIENIVSIIYSIGVGGIPSIDLKIVGDIDIESEAVINKETINPGLDGVDF